MNGYGSTQLEDLLAMHLPKKTSSLAGRIGLAILLTSTAALLLATVTFVTIEIQSYKRNLVEHLAVVSQIVATNSTAAIDFNDPKTAELVLRSLEAEPGMLAAGIYLANGERFTAYGSTSASIKHLDEFNVTLHTNNLGMQHHFHGDLLDILFPIQLDGEVLGQLRLTAEISPMYTKLASYLQNMAGVLVVLIALVVLASRRLRQRIAAPVERLAEGMRRVSEHQDYSLRLKPEGDQEVARLTAGLNNMLEQIQERDQRLLQHRDDLERTIEERTHDLRIARDEALASKDAAEMASRAKSEFLATMSHEIRTPMNGVLGMTELLLSTELGQRQRRFAETIQRSGDALLMIINDILDFSKIEAGRLELVDEDFNLRDLVDDTAELMAERAHSKGLELNPVIPLDLPLAVRGDATRLRQVLVNLIGNAIKFTEQGEVIIQLQLLELSEQDMQMRFEVIDTGIGISSSKQQEIFESFSQGDSTTTRRYGGTGLGLAISSQLVSLMGGEIGVESDLGKGATFWFSVPLARSVIAVERELKRKDLHGVRLLIVDDNATNREILHNQAIAWNMPHDTVEGGGEALEKLRMAAATGEPYDIVILDWHMPEMDGIELAGLIQADPAIPAVHQVMLSSAAFDEEAAKAMAQGIERYLNKPVKQSVLYDCLKGVMAAPTGSITPALKKEHEAKVLRGRILVAEDNRVNQEVTRSMLELLGCEVEIVSNGREAVEAVSSGIYDLVLMDYHMPEMDGWEASTEIRRMERAVNDTYRGVPIIALTADVQKGVPEKCLDHGMNAFLSKPFRQSQLAQLLTQWLPQDEEASSRTDAILDAIVVDSGDPVLDQSVLDRIRALQQPNTPSVLAQVIGIYLEDSPEMIKKLKHALEQGDIAGLTETAHSLKSSSANLGASRLSSLCKELEHQGEKSAAEDLAELVRRIDTEFESAHFGLQRELEHQNIG